MTNLRDLPDVCECGCSGSIHDANGLCYGFKVSGFIQSGPCGCTQFRPVDVRRNRSYQEGIDWAFKESEKDKLLGDPTMVKQLKRGNKRSAGL